MTLNYKENWTSSVYYKEHTSSDRKIVCGVNFPLDILKNLRTNNHTCTEIDTTVDHGVINYRYIQGGFFNLPN